MRWSSKFDLKLLRQQNTGLAGARNRGVTEAQGKFLAFRDDDCLPTPAWLEKPVAALRENPEALVGDSTFNGFEKKERLHFRYGKDARLYKQIRAQRSSGSMGANVNFHRNIQQMAWKQRQQLARVRFIGFLSLVLW